MDIKARLSTFWIVVMINIAFADIFAPLTGSGGFLEMSETDTSIFT